MEDFQLHRAHHLDTERFRPFLPADPELGFLLLQLPQLHQGPVGVIARGHQHLAGDDRTEPGFFPAALRPQALAGPGLAEARDGNYVPGESFLPLLELAAAVKTELAHLFRPAGTG